MTSTSFLQEPVPYTPIEPVVEISHGVPVTDPYRWLEENSERTRRWICEQTSYSRAYLNRIPGRERIAGRIAELLSVEVISTPVKVGNRSFFLKRQAHADYPLICMQEGDESDLKCLVDPILSEYGYGASIHIVAVSKDAKLLAYGIKYGGEDSENVEILDVSNRTKVDVGLPRGFLHGLVFAPDSKSIYYAHQVIGGPQRHAVYQHFIGTRSQEDREVFFAGNDPNTQLSIWKLSDRYMGYWVTRWGATVANDLYLHDLLNDASPYLVAEEFERPFVPYVLDGQIFAMTTWQAPNGRIVAFDLRSTDKRSWREIVPESPSLMKSFAVTGNRLLVSYYEDISTRTDIYNTIGEKVETLPYPKSGSCKVFSGSSENDEVFYEFTSFTQPPTTFCYNLKTKEQRVWAQKKVPFDTSSLIVNQSWYSSKDGTSVPMFLVSNRSLSKTKKNPTILTAYGGFGASMTPLFRSYLAFLIEKGCLVAVPNIRGGSELGREWHRAGKGPKRQNAFDDFIGAAEWLMANEYTTRERLAIVGGSNGGLLVGAALTQRPDLFRAVVCIGPLLDMLRFHRFDSARFWVDEYGSPDDPEDFAYLAAYSPYHQVREGVDYPAVLFISGDADTRCNALHVRKMTAMLQARNASINPILMDYRKLRGHLPGLPLDERIEAMTDRVAFICDQLGIAV